MFHIPEPANKIHYLHEMVPKEIEKKDETKQSPIEKKKPRKKEDKKDNPYC